MDMTTLLGDTHAHDSYEVRLFDGLCWCEQGLPELWSMFQRKGTEECSSLCAMMCDNESPPSNTAASSNMARIPHKDVAIDISFDTIASEYNS